jgi:mannitol/fructose-specific phosphotransferase system IIA component (Ntr-type)
MARTSLITLLRNNQIHLETNAKMSKEVLDKLATIFETKDVVSNAFATTHFHSQKMSETKSVEKHI